MLLLSVSAVAQTTPDAATQEWLVATMERSGSYSDGSFTHRLRNVVLGGCKLSFDAETFVSRNPYPRRPPANGDLRTQGTTPDRPDIRRVSSFSFDLFDIDPSTVEERIAPGKMRSLLLKAIDQDDAIKFRHDITGQPTTSGTYRSIALTLETKVIPEFKKRLIAYIRVCNELPTR